jgi:putative ATP-dependent endonuclease of OLD family
LIVAQQVLPPEAVAEELVAEVIGVEVADGGQPAHG